MFHKTYFHFIEILDVSLSVDVECSNSTCHTEISKLQEEVKASEGRIQEAKKKYHGMLAQNLKKDIQINQLENETKHYNKFRANISAKTISKLNSFDSSVSKDSLFISTVVKDLYKNDLSKLKERTYSGRVNTKCPKHPITPEKKKVLMNLFRERVGNSDIRMKNLSKHVKQAIETINRTKK